MEKLHKNSKTQKVTEVVSAKPVLGLPLGNTKITFYYIDDSALEYEGFISDVTGLFVNPDVQADFKRVVLEEISFLKANSFKPIEPEEDKPLTVDVGQETVESETALATSISNCEGNIWKVQNFEKSALHKAILVFKNFDFAKACRVLLLESGGSTLHLILQVGRIDPLATYANNIDRSQWSFVRGLKYDFLAGGSAITLPHRQLLDELGEVFLHVFMPDDRHENSKVDFKVLNEAKQLLPIVPYIPGTVNIDQTLKSMKREVEIAHDASKLATERISEKSVRNEAAKLATASYEENSPEDSFTHSRFDFTDALLIGAPTFLCSLVGWWSFDPTSMGWIGGLGIGFILGCFFVSRRK